MSYLVLPRPLCLPLFISLYHPQGATTGGSTVNSGWTRLSNDGWPWATIDLAKKYEWTAEEVEALAGALKGSATSLSDIVQSLGLVLPRGNVDGFGFGVDKRLQQDVFGSTLPIAIAGSKLFLFSS